MKKNFAIPVFDPVETSASSNLANEKSISDPVQPPVLQSCLTICHDYNLIQPLVFKLCIEIIATPFSVLFRRGRMK